MPLPYQLDKILLYIPHDIYKSNLSLAMGLLNIFLHSDRVSCYRGWPGKNQPKPTHSMQVTVATSYWCNVVQIEVGVMFYSNIPIIKLSFKCIIINVRTSVATIRALQTEFNQLNWKGTMGNRKNYYKNIQ